MKQLIEKDLNDMADLVELPDDCIPIDGVMVVQYLDENGKTNILFKTTDSYTSHLVGLLNMTAWQLMHLRNNE